MTIYIFIYIVRLKIKIALILFKHFNLNYIFKTSIHTRNIFLQLANCNFLIWILLCGYKSG